MTQIIGCGLLGNPNNFFIDHLAPLCAFFEFPIVTPFAENVFKYSRYYPDCKILVKNCSVRFLLENYTHVLYSSNPKPSFKDIIESEREKNPQEPIWQRPLKLIHHFHGCSDKGYHSNWISPNSHIKDLDLLLIYGKRFEKLLKDKKLYHLPKNIGYVGNYRYEYYLKHQNYLDNLVESEVFSQFDKKQQTLLYAPTWQDHENSSSFLEMQSIIIDQLPCDLNLIIKLHPNLLDQEPLVVRNLLEKSAKLSNVVILTRYPLIYPLIKKCDFYLSDHSSVSYDVLTFNKPMFFLNITTRPLTDKGAYIFKCGRVIEKKDFKEIYSIIRNEKSNYLSYQKKLYLEAFGTKFSVTKDLLKNL